MILWKKNNILWFMRKWVNFQSSVSLLQGYTGCRLSYSEWTSNTKLIQNYFQNILKLSFGQLQNYLNAFSSNTNVFDQNMLRIAKKKSFRVQTHLYILKPHFIIFMIIISIWIKSLEWRKNDSLYLYRMSHFILMTTMYKIV